MKIFVCISFCLASTSCMGPLDKITLRTDSSGKESVVKDTSSRGSDDALSQEGKNAVPMPNTPSVPDVPRPPAEGTATQVPPVGPSVPAPNASIPSCTKSAPIGKNKKICEATVAGVRVKFVPLAEGVKATRLAFYLHGDTAKDWTNPFVVAAFVDWAATHKVVLVLPLSTAKYDDDAADEFSYGAAQPADADKLSKLVESFIASYQTPSDNLLYFGTSGGPWFMSSSYIPLYAGKFPGLFALSCGASSHWNKERWDFKDASIRNKIKIFFNYGDQDFLLKSEEQSFAYYQKVGIDVSKKVYPGKGHCDHDIEKATINFWEANMK